MAPVETRHALVCLIHRGLFSCARHAGLEFALMLHRILRRETMEAVSWQIKHEPCVSFVDGYPP